MQPFSTEATHLVLENAVNIDNLITISQVGIKEHIIKKKYAAVIFLLPVLPVMQS